MSHMAIKWLSIANVACSIFVSHAPSTSSSAPTHCSLTLMLAC